MGELQQGQIRWAKLPEPAGRRPVLILTRNDALAILQNVTVAPLTRTIRYLDSEVVLTPDDGLPSLCAASLDNILTIRKASLGPLIANIPDDRWPEVLRAIRFVFGMLEGSTPGK